MNFSHNQHANSNSPEKLKDHQSGDFSSGGPLQEGQNFSLSPGSISDGYTYDMATVRQTKGSKKGAPRPTQPNKRISLSEAPNAGTGSTSSTASHRSREIPCPRPGCGRFYSSENSLRNHLRIKHAYRGPRARQDSLNRKEKHGARDAHDKLPYMASFNDHCGYRVARPPGVEPKKVSNRNSWPACPTASHQTWSAEYIGSANADQPFDVSFKWQLERSTSSQSCSPINIVPHHTSKAKVAEPIVWCSAEACRRDDDTLVWGKEERRLEGARRGTFPYLSQHGYASHVSGSEIAAERRLSESYDSEVNAALPRHARAKVCASWPVWTAESQTGPCCPAIGPQFLAHSTPAVVPGLVSLWE